MKKENSSSLTDEQRTRLERLAALPDEKIDTTDVPEACDWTGGRRGLFYSGAQTSDHVAIGVRSDVVDWFESNSESEQDIEARINRVLSEHIAEQTRKAS